jgi:ribonucleotide reductase, class II
MNDFPASAPSANPLFYRTYSRKDGRLRETWDQVSDRTIEGLRKLGNLTDEEVSLLREMQDAKKCLPSGRWLWVGGTKWLEDPKNYFGGYNCSSTYVTDWEAFALMMGLAMMGCGTGSVLSNAAISQLPVVLNKLNIKIAYDIGEDYDPSKPVEDTTLDIDSSMNWAYIQVGDSRQGWVDSYHNLLKLSSDKRFNSTRSINVTIDLSFVRPPGHKLKGFGGVSNPIKLADMYTNVAGILNQAQKEKRSLNSVECCLVNDHPSIAIVAGNLRRSASIHQFDSTDLTAATIKDNLWRQDEDGSWSIDPERDALRMANHTRVYHHKPSRKEVIDAVTKQFYSGEGAIQFGPESIARSNADLLTTTELKNEFIRVYSEEGKDKGLEYLKTLKSDMDEYEQHHRINRYGMNPCFAPGTMVMTKEGYFPIEDLVGKEVEVHDGKEWRKVDNFRVTANDQDVYTITLYSGMKITATEYHNFILSDGTKIQLKDLAPGMELKSANVEPVEGSIKAKGAYLKGFLIGDGTHHKDYTICKVYEPKQVCVDRLIESQKEIGVKQLVTSNGETQELSYGLTPAGYLKNLSVRSSESLVDWAFKYKKTFPNEVFNWDDNSKAEFIAGLFDADGTARDGGTEKGISYQITSVSRNFLEGLDLLLRTLGINSRIGPVRSRGSHDFGPDRGGAYEVQDNYRLSIAKPGSIKLAKLCKFERLKSFADRKVYNITPSNANKIESIEYSHNAPNVYCCTVEVSHTFTLASQVLVGQCSEVLGMDFLCNLSEVHLNMIDPEDDAGQDKAFRAGGLAVAALLNHTFTDERYRKSREIDPIVGVSFTGLFDFFVKKFGLAWLQWWEAGRPETKEGLEFKRVEAECLNRWRVVAEESIQEYCIRHSLKVPNRCTVVQPAGSKSLLTGASSGWHPPKAQRFIRRITFRKDDPVALACIDYGYNVVPSQSDKDENGKLLNDPFDTRCTEWLVEIPTEVDWSNIPGADQVDIHNFSALAQFDFYMQVQKYYTRHNTSATIEYRENEIELLGNKIYEVIRDDEGYNSVAMLARFDANETFPRLPFEPIDKETYERLSQEVLDRRVNDNFFDALAKYDDGDLIEAGPAGCDSDKCLMPLAVPV